MCKMFIITVLFYTLTNSVYSLEASHDLKETAIFGGNIISIEKHPYQVDFLGCGGAILSPTWILTAAHCGTWRKGVRVGSSYVDMGEYYNIKSRHVFPEYKSEEKNGDFMLLELSEALHLSDTVKVIELGVESDMKPGNAAVVSGWGKTEDGSFSKVLREVTVKIVADEICQKNYETASIHFQSTYMLCASDQRKDACIGDSGGPLVVNDKLVGLVSFGINCADPNYPGVYASVPAVLDWIKKTAQL